MYFKLSGKIDVSSMLDNEIGGINTEKFCQQITENKIKIDSLITCAKVKRNEDYYEDMHPKMLLFEDYLDKDISNDEIKNIFLKFLKPLNVDKVKLVIIDPYIFAKGLNKRLLLEIIKSNCTFKEINFITKQANENYNIKNYIDNDLQANGFHVEVIHKNDIHDRWWYTRCNGFTTGISFNGFTTKNSTIKMLDQSELNSIINQYEN